MLGFRAAYRTSAIPIFEEAHPGCQALFNYQRTLLYSQMLSISQKHFK